MFNWKRFVKTSSTLTSFGKFSPTDNIDDTAGIQPAVLSVFIISTS